MDFQDKWKNFLVEVSSADAMQNLRGSAGDKILNAWAYDMLQIAKADYEKELRDLESQLDHSGDIGDQENMRGEWDTVWDIDDGGVLQFLKDRVGRYALMMPGKKFRNRYGPELKGMIADTIEETVIPQDIADNQKGAATLWFVRALRKNAKVRSTELGTATSSIRDYIISIEASHLFGPDEEMSRFVDNLEHIINNTRRSLEMFFQYPDFMETKDLNRIQGPDQLMDIVDKARKDVYAHQEKQKNLDADEGTEVFRDDDEWYIAAIHNKGAACEFGKGTEWCTAVPNPSSDERDMFKQYYSPETPLFVLIPKGGKQERYQVSYGGYSRDGEDPEFKDVRDKEVDEETRFKLHKLITATSAKDYPFIQELSDTFLAGNPNISEEDAIRLIKAGDPYVIESLATNKGVPERALRYIHNRKGLSREHQRYGSPYSWITNRIAKNPSAPTDILSDMLNFYNRKHEDSIGIDQSSSALAALGNPNISKDLLHKILSGESDFKINHTWKINNAVFNNPSLDDQFLSKYITPEWASWWAEIFSHPNLGRESLNKMISDPNFNTFLGPQKLGARIGKILNNPQLDSKLLMKLYKDQQTQRDAKERRGASDYEMFEAASFENVLKQIENSPKFVKKENFHKKWKKKLKEQTTILGLSNKYNNLGQAINEKKVVTIFYEGDRTVSRGARAIEPVVLGTHFQSGNPVVRAWQIQGASDTPDNLPGWRMFRVDRISRLKVTENTFDTPRPQYDPNDDHIASQDATAQFGAALQERRSSRLKLVVYEQKVVKNFKQWRKFVKEAKSRKEKDLDIYSALKKVAKGKEKERFGAEKEKAYAQRAVEKGNETYIHNIRQILDNVTMAQLPNYIDIDKGKLKVARDPDEFLKKNISVFTDVADEIPSDNPLKSNKIVDLLGAGAYGVVFELDNGHAFKLFSGGVRGEAAEEELQWYKEMKSDQFTGASRRGELAVFGSGNLTTSNFDVAWAEIGQVVPLKMWAKQKGASPLLAAMHFDGVYRLLQDLAFGYNSNVHPDDRDIEPIKENPSSKDKIQYVKYLLGLVHESPGGLPKESEHGYNTMTLAKILKEILEIAVKKGDLLVFDTETADVHAGNIGFHLADDQPVVFDR